MASSAEAERPLRRDAVRNRALILDAAAEVFAEDGIEAGYDEIARRAGVGVGTVYRRFPERDELVRALFRSRIEAIIAIAERAAESEDAWDGLVQFLEGTLAHQVADRGLKDVMMGVISADDHHQLGRDRIAPLLEDLVARAQDEGALRPGVGARDIGVVLMLVATVDSERRPDLWRRYLAVHLDGLRARPDQAPLPQEPPDEAVMQGLLAARRPR